MKTVTIRFSNGKTIERTLADQMGEQALDLGGVEARWLQLTVRSVYAGWKYTDTAISEIRVDAR